MSTSQREPLANYVPPSNLADLSSFMAGRLIALVKCPGVQPIGIGEVCRWITARAIIRILQPDIQETAGPFQLCGGQLAGCEAAVHAIRSMYSDSKVHEGFLPVDASNALTARIITLLWLILPASVLLCQKSDQHLQRTLTWLWMVRAFLQENVQHRVIHLLSRCTP